MNNILYSPKAQADLDEIWDYISDKLQSPSAAQNTVNGILDTIEMLREQVEIGKPLYFSSGLYSGYRYLIYRNYLAFYRIVSDTVYIDRVIYGKRDYMRLLFGGAEEQYDYQCIDEGMKGYEEIICYGAAFFQKQVKLKMK